jgi:prepilin peptidase CpaA
MLELAFSTLLVFGVGLLILSALHDIATRTIPNWIPASIAVIGSVLRYRDHEVLLSLEVALAIFGFLILLWFTGFIGGGDVKLIPAVSMIVHPPDTPGLVLSITIVGGGLALLYLALSYLIPGPSPGMRSGLISRLIKAETWRIHRRGPLPYGVAIAIGALRVIAGSFYR